MLEPNWLDFVPVSRLLICCFFAVVLLLAEDAVGWAQAASTTDAERAVRPLDEKRAERRLA